MGRNLTRNSNLYKVCFDKWRLSKIYEAIREHEKSAKEILLNFQEKYTDVLRDENLDHILQNQQTKQNLLEEVKQKTDD